MKIWIPKLKEKNRDVTRFVETAAEEGGRQLRNASQAEREHLREVATNCAVSHEDEFLRIWSDDAVEEEGRR